ncbi:MAG: hypothetical protein K8R35_02400 [Bacteroidales bacterium]|nr:hypothetical protein [Bacteroidales bacterium]
MKLEAILSKLNSLEKNSFIKIIDNIINNSPNRLSEIEKILNECSSELKNIDNINISKIFTLVEDEFIEHVTAEFVDPNSQLDIIADILTRDGRCIASRDWFSRLYENEISFFDKKLKLFSRELKNDDSQIEQGRLRDYSIYKACIVTAYYNDEENNQERKITTDEQSILLTLSKKLGFSKEEQKLVNYSVLPIIRKDIDSVINELKSMGILFYSRKFSTVYIPQEIVAVLRKIRGKDIADKYFRRVLKHIREPLVNVICRKHNIDWKQDIDQKIELIISSGISFTDLLIHDIHKENTSLTDKKKYFIELTEKHLGISPSVKGTLIEDKICNLINYYNDLELDEKVQISLDGYEKLIREFGEKIPKLNEYLKKFFEIQKDIILSSDLLLSYNLKPQDILEIMPSDDLKIFTVSKGIKTRGDIIGNILDSYKDAENIYLENYEHIAYRNHNQLKQNDILIHDADIGVKFEELTKKIFARLGLNVDEDLRKKLNTKKAKIDIVINLGNKNLIMIECKSVKDSGYNEFTSVYRQLKAYRDLAIKNEYNVLKSLLIAPEFTDEFINECEIEYELNLSLITAGSLKKIFDGFKNSRMEQLPYKLLMRDVLIQPERILKAIK